MTGAVPAGRTEADGIDPTSEGAGRPGGVDAKGPGAAGAGGTTGTVGADRALGLPARAAWLVPLGLVVTAAILRTVDLATRGPWDRDQGHDMLQLLGLVRDGTIPLLGPPTSIGDFHHGALYYYLLAPAAFVSDADPTAVVAFMAATGVAAVAVTWWLARSIGGPWAGLVAGVLLAVSATAVETSTWIWNPNLIPLASAVALAGAWWAWDARRPAGWIAAATGALVTVQCHVLGSVLLPPLVVLWVLDLRRRQDPAEQRSVWNVGLASLLLLAAGLVPLAIHELTHGFSETAAAIDFLSGGGSGTSVDPLTRLLVVGVRVTTWPLVGLFVDAPYLAVTVAAGIVALIAWVARSGSRRERAAMRFLGGTLAWSWLALTLGAASLATVVRELPVDHYHAFLDPLVAVVAGVGLAAVARRGRSAASVARRGGPVAGIARRGGPVAAVVALVVVGLVGWNLATQPAAVVDDGGWPAAEEAGARILATADGAELAFIGLPDFKGPAAYVFPVERAGGVVMADGETLPAGGMIVVLCEDLWREAIGASCGGPAEDPAAAASAAAAGRRLVLRERFAPAPGRLLSLYRVEGG